MCRAPASGRPDQIAQRCQTSPHASNQAQAQQGEPRGGLRGHTGSAVVHIRRRLKFAMNGVKAMQTWRMGGMQAFIPTRTCPGGRLIRNNVAVCD
jgi:hypothetical protein